MSGLMAVKTSLAKLNTQVEAVDPFQESVKSLIVENHWGQVLHFIISFLNFSTESRVEGVGYGWLCPR